MHTNIEWERDSFYCDKISQSIELQPEFSGDQSPIIKKSNFQFQLKPIPLGFLANTSQNLFVDLATSESQMSMDNEMIINKYKCFSCFGQNNHFRLQQRQICQECKGTEFIHNYHPFINILQRIMSINFSFYNEKGQSRQQQKEDKKRFKIYQKDMNPQNYLSKSQKSILLSHQNDQQSKEIEKRQLIKQSQNLSKSQKLQMKFNCQNTMKNLLLRPSYIKKISEEAEQQQQLCTAKEDYTCVQCQKQIQQSYQYCQNCFEIGLTFKICKQCSLNNYYIHKFEHSLILKTAQKSCKLRKIQSKSSTNGSKHEPIQYKTPILENSIVDIHAPTELFESTSLNINFLKSLKINPENTVSNMMMEQRQQQAKNPTELLKQYDMDCSIELHYKDNLYTNKLTEIYNYNSVFGQNNTEWIKQELYFNDYYCDICQTTPIKNVRYHCLDCQDYDLCSICYINRAKQHHHNQFKIIKANQKKIKQQNLLLKSIKLSHKNSYLIT